MISLALLAICAILSLGAIRSSYWVLRFFAGSTWTLLTVYWINNPILTVGSQEQNLLIMVLFGIAFAFYFMIFWNSTGDFAGRFRGGLRRLFMGDEEAPSASPREARRARNAEYQSRVDAALRGERRR